LPLRARSVGGRVIQEPRVLQAPHELPQGELHLQPSERGAEAVVDAAAEPEVLVVLPPRIEPLGVLEARRVAAPGGEQQQDGRTGGDRGVADRDVAERGAPGQHLHRRLEAQ
jgi:hypothetical protein